MKIRARAHAAAVTVVEDQKENFRRWGVMADWDHPYRTLGMRRLRKNRGPEVCECGWLMVCVCRQGV